MVVTNNQTYLEVALRGRLGILLPRHSAAVAVVVSLLVA